MKEYDPYWPFPQYDENGKQLLPKRQPKKQIDLEDYEDAPI